MASMVATSGMSGYRGTELLGGYDGSDRRDYPSSEKIAQKLRHPIGCPYKLRRSVHQLPNIISVEGREL